MKLFCFCGFISIFILLDRYIQFTDAQSQDTTTTSTITSTTNKNLEKKGPDIDWLDIVISVSISVIITFFTYLVIELIRLSTKTKKGLVNDGKSNNWPCSCKKSNDYVPPAPNSPPPTITFSSPSSKINNQIVNNEIELQDYKDFTQLMDAAQQEEYASLLNNLGENDEIYFCINTNQTNTADSENLNQSYIVPVLQENIGNYLTTPPKVNETASNIAVDTITSHKKQSSETNISLDNQNLNPNSSQAKVINMGLPKRNPQIIIATKGNSGKRIQELIQQLQQGNRPNIHSPILNKKF